LPAVGANGDLVTAVTTEIGDAMVIDFTMGGMLEVSGFTTMTTCAVIVVVVLLWWQDSLGFSGVIGKLTLVWTTGADSGGASLLHSCITITVPPP